MHLDFTSQPPDTATGKVMLTAATDRDHATTKFMFQFHAIISTQQNLTEPTPVYEFEGQSTFLYYYFIVLNPTVFEWRLK